MVRGHINKAEERAQLTANVLKRMPGPLLTDEESVLEWQQTDYRLRNTC
jgi:hypothetical protein